MEVTETPEERRRRLGRERQRRWREKNPGAGAAASRRRRAENPGYVWPAKERLADEVMKVKQNPCVDCGERFPFVCMDFDHVRGTKTNNVGTMVSHGHSREKVLTEIAKCDLVCANCHRIRTWERRTGTKISEIEHPPEGTV